MPVPIVDGTSFCTVSVYSKEKLDTVIDFYEKSLSLEGKTFNNVTNETILTDGSLHLKVLLYEDGMLSSTMSQQAQYLKATEKFIDLRSLMDEYITFSVGDLLLVKGVLDRFKLPYQCKPNDINPIAIYSVDPQGNVVGFTSLKNGIGSKTPSKFVGSSLLQSKVASRGYSTADLKTKDVSASKGLDEVASTPKKAIAIITSGGDAPGMNSCVRAIVRSCIFHNCQPYVVMEGYKGLVQGGPKYFKKFNWDDVSGWNSKGGTNIGTARCMEFKEREGRLSAALNLISNEIDALIVCGGDGSLTGADIFRSEWPSLLEELQAKGKITKEQVQKHRHLNICGTVGSIDNDMATTDSTIGAYSALDRICEAVDYVEATAKSHSRAFVIEVMGRNCGWLGLMAGIATSADYVLIPEEAVNPEAWKDEMCDVVSRHRNRGKRTTIVIVSEGAIDRDLNPVTSDDVSRTLVDKLGLDTRITKLGHVQRGGAAVGYDRILATLQGVEAVNAILDSTPETPSPIITVNENKIFRKSLVDSVKLTKSVADAIKAKDFGKVLKLRDPEFLEHYQNYIAINAADNYEPQLPLDKRLRIAIVNVGAPAGGINSAVYSMATFCLSQGHKPYAIFNGWSGLSRHESVKSLNWEDIIGWQSRGGSELGTNRDTPSTTDIGMIAYYFQKYQFDGLIIVGGFEGFLSLHELERARDVFPAFQIPMVLIPATLSNNVPGTEYSLGTDTALNSLMKYCDILKQAASSTRGRVFVVDTQGGNSGFLATTASIAVGARLSYVPEEGIELRQLSHDIKNIAKKFEHTKIDDTESGVLILKTTNASKALSVDNLAKVMTSESNGEFVAKPAIPGHIQQGGKPSPIDRTRATRLAIRAVTFIEDTQAIVNKSGTKLYNGDENYDPLNKEMMATAAVLGTKGSSTLFSPVNTVYEKETNVKKRMPKVIHWESLRSIADHLSERERIY